MTEDESPAMTSIEPELTQPAFVGETSMIHALRQTEARLDSLAAYREGSLDTNISALTPTPSSDVTATVEKRSRGWLRAILRCHGIAREISQHYALLRSFFDEVHVLYPFLHPPAVWQTYEFLSRRSLNVSADDLAKNGESRTSLAILFLGLAVGRCTSSSRVDDADGTHSAGWSFFNVSMYLLRQPLNLTEDCAISVQGLQALMMMVVYLFRLDANERAERILGYAISSAHILGLHRRMTYTPMRLVEAESCVRAWWCLYVLDRRMSLETGRPFVIQDANVDTRYPLALSDAWLEEHKFEHQMTDDLEAEAQLDVARSGVNAIPYFIAMISYSKIVGNVWTAVNSPEQSSCGTNTMARNYIDLLLENFTRSLPPSLSWPLSPISEDQLTNLEWWQIKQRVLIRLRCIFLKILIRRPRAQESSSLPEIERAQLAASIIEIFDSIPAHFPKFLFPFTHFIMAATMVLFGIVVKSPELQAQHCNSILSATHTLVLCCRKSWVSGKTIRTISRLNFMVQRTLVDLTDRAPHQKQAGNAAGAPAEARTTSETQLVVNANLSTSQSALPVATAPRIRGQSQESPGSASLSAGTHPLERHTSAGSSVRMMDPVRPDRRPMLADGADRLPPAWPVAPNAPVSHVAASSPRHDVQPAQVSGPGPAENCDSTVSDALPWPMSTSTVDDLPSWAMTDFEFEQEFQFVGPVGAFNFMGSNL
ncbi:uncharacterized protein A1O9_12584 [Exophiala aquamarina CBS 119918]|uniref:Xylanolytic transcriptional activator regulatory domain-containing protein n=1 Tax=Exophiala aquamarina CBS 119918 TaxID=1182545 RepID=A0A072P761_9EURO|nr:uncharacterized protein A1O9_12584 [Exophiala aquamarina CBS 119918]KEF51435.1 hypothetical protein A1O9_12584 [Exophiala aquamarina CBS 119918]